MHRRRFLAGAAVAGFGGAGGTTGAASAAARSPSAVTPTTARSPPGIAWHRTYAGIDVAAVAPAHGGGHVVVNLGSDSGPDRPLPPVRVALLHESGAVRRRQEVDAPSEARRAVADLVRTDGGYAVAVGTWVALLGPDLTVEATGFAPEFHSGPHTYVAGFSGGAAVANDGTGLHDPKQTRVLGFDADGTLRWNWQYHERGTDDWGTTRLGFLCSGPEGGSVVGGSRLGTGHTWVASIAPDGTERWKATLSDRGHYGFGATADGDGVTLVGESGLLRLALDGAVVWQRSDGEFERGGDSIAHTSDGGYVFSAGSFDVSVGIARTDPTGNLLWHHAYPSPFTADPAFVHTGLVERAPGEYLLVGYLEDEAVGWAMLLSESAGPAPTPEATPTPSVTHSSTPTRTTRAALETTEADDSSGSIPGFGFPTALAGGAGLAAGWLARSR